VNKIYRNVFDLSDVIFSVHALAVPRFPFKHLEEFRRLEKEASDNERGLWTKAL